MQVQQNRSIFKVIVNKIHHSNLDHKNRTVTSDRPVLYDFFRPYTYQYIIRVEKY